MQKLSEKEKEMRELGSLELLRKVGVLHSDKRELQE